MAGTITGGQKAAATNKENDPDFYKRIGKMGADSYIEKQRQGIAKPRGFAYNRELAKTAGAIGGAKSKRTKNEN